jgi:hypothetical protein
MKSKTLKITPNDFDHITPRSASVISISYKHHENGQYFDTRSSNQLDLNCNSRNRASLMSKRFVELSVDSKVHGYSNIFKTKYQLVRVVWICSILIAFSLSFYLIYMGINDYLKYSTTTRIQLLHESPQTFPRITLCQSSPFVWGNSAVSFFSDLLLNSNDENLNALRLIVNQANVTQRDLYIFFKSNPIYLEYLKAVASDPRLDNFTKQSFGFSLV